MRLKSPARGVFDIIRASVSAGQRARRPSRRVLEGLTGPVEVLTDTRGVAHITAHDRHDLFFAQGYVTARDRFFQMDFNRHAASGRMSEFLGRRTLPWRELTVHLKERTTVDVDVMMRTFGIARAARASLPLHSRQSRDLLAAYAAGVNAFVATGFRSLEHRLLRFRSGPWAEVDSLTLVRAMAFELNFAWRSILFGAMVDGAGLPDDVKRVLCPQQAAGASSIVGASAWASMARDLAATRRAADAALGLGNAAGVGSNSFAVAGSHARDGDALLANDIHLTLTAPLPMHEVHLTGGGLDVHGFALAGVPGIVIGRTKACSWGITAGLVHDLDLFVEKLHPTDPSRYLTPDGWQSLYERREVFQVRGEGEHQRSIFESRHGPLLETVATEPEPGHRFAIAWTGHQPGRELDSLLGMWLAEDLDEFAAALGHLVCPTYNLAVASADGRVGYVLAGRIPRRRVGTPLRPLEGWTGQWDWQGLVPFEHNPREIDPARGFVVTANNRPAPDGYPYELGNLFEPAYRYERIRKRIEALGDQVTAEALASIQLDVYSAWGAEVRDGLFAAVGGVDGLVDETQSHAREAAELWWMWDGYASAESAGAAIAMVTALTTGSEVVRRLAGDDVAFGFAELGAMVGSPIARLPEISHRLASLGIDLADVVRFCFAEAVRVCCEAMGEPSEWRWGALHPIVCGHRFGGTPLGAFFAIGPEPAGGGPDTVNRGDVGAGDFTLRVGPAMRIVVNARDRDRAGFVMPGGQSGDRLSPHYDDQLDDFLAGRLRTAPVSREAIAVEEREHWLPRS